MRVGLFFGSFNPIHIGHLIIANHLINYHEIDELWFIVSPQNPFKVSKTLLNERHRYAMVKLAIEGEKKLKASDVEFGLPRPSYTINTLAYLQEKYPSFSFSIIMGSDSFQNIENWKNAELLLKNYSFIIYSRPGIKLTGTHNAKITVADAPLLEISSTRIREMIKGRKSIRYLVPDIVKEEIDKNLYYASYLENPSQE